MTKLVGRKAVVPKGATSQSHVKEGTEGEIVAVYMGTSGIGNTMNLMVALDCKEGVIPLPIENIKLLPPPERPKPHSSIRGQAPKTPRTRPTPAEPKPVGGSGVTSPAEQPLKSEQPAEPEIISRDFHFRVDTKFGYLDVFGVLKEIESLDNSTKQSQVQGVRAKATAVLPDFYIDWHNEALDIPDTDYDEDEVIRNLLASDIQKAVMDSPYVEQAAVTPV